MIIHHASYKPDDILTSEFFSAYLLWFGFGFYQFPKEMANPTAAFIYENFLPLGVTISTQIKSNHNDIMTSNYFAQYDPAINNVVERAHTHTHRINTQMVSRFTSNIFRLNLFAICVSIQSGSKFIKILPISNGSVQLNRNHLFK